MIANLTNDPINRRDPAIQADRVNQTDRANRRGSAAGRSVLVSGGLPNRRTLPAQGEGRLQCGLVHRTEDLEECFRLVYRAYRRAGLVAPNSFEQRLTYHHLLDSTDVFATWLGDEIVSTVSMIGDGDMGLPLEKMFPVEVQSLRGLRLRMAEIGSLADRRESPSRFLATLLDMMHLVTQAARHRGYDGIVAAVHPRHAKLYCRLMPFQQIGSELSCDYANGHPAVFLVAAFDWQFGSDAYRRFFGQMRPESELVDRPWSPSTVDHFQRMLDRIQDEIDAERSSSHPGQTG